MELQHFARHEKIIKKVIFPVFLFSFLVLSGCGKKAEAATKSVSGSSSAASVSSAPASSAKETPEAVPMAATQTSVSSQQPAAAETEQKVLILPQSTADNGKLLSVQNIQQYPELQSGCEVTSAAMVLRYFGYSVTNTGLADYLKCDSSFTQKDGKTFGPSPWQSFVGSPEQDKYGCYAPVLEAAVNDYLDTVQGKHKAYNLTGTSADKLYDLVSKGVPVIVWATTSMEKPSLGPGWYFNGTGEYFQWVEGEHCMVLIGYTDSMAVFSDPQDMQGTVSYDRSLFEERYQDLYEQAIVIV